MSTNSIQPPNPLIITKRHIIAVSITTLMLSLFTGVVGYQSGRKLHMETQDTTVASLLPNVDDQASLEELLLEIEQTKHIRSDNDYQFVNELQKNTPISIPAVPETLDNETVIQADPGALQIPEVAPNALSTLPTTGWSIQVGSYPTLEESQVQMDRWTELGQEPYVVTASVDGEVWYRARLSGLSDKAQAEALKETLQGQMNEFDYIVVRAP
jgi:cell division protein FtsN